MLLGIFHLQGNLRNRIYDNVLMCIPFRGKISHSHVTFG